MMLIECNLVSEVPRKYVKQVTNISNTKPIMIRRTECIHLYCKIFASTLNNIFHHSFVVRLNKYE